MNKFGRQYDLFNKIDETFLLSNDFQTIYLDKKSINEWQQKIIGHQSTVFKCGHKKITQPSLFETSSVKSNERFNPIAQH